MSLEVDKPQAGRRGFGVDTVVRRSSQRLPRLYGRGELIKQPTELAAGSYGKVKGRRLMKSPRWQIAKF